MFPDGFEGILRAGGGIAASGGKQWGYAVLVEFDGNYQQEGEQFLDKRHVILFWWGKRGRWQSFAMPP